MHRMGLVRPLQGFQTRTLALCGMLAAVLLVSAFGAAQVSSQILAKDAKWVEISHIGTVWGEGVVAAKDGKIYVSDITYSAVIKENNPRGTIYCYDPAKGTMTKYMEPSGMANGLHVDKRGDLIIVQDADFGGRAVLRRNLSTGATVVLANGYQGKHFNGPNDVTSDAQGRIYFTDTRYRGDEPMELPHAFYRIDPNGKLTRLATDIIRPNGIEVSADSRRLYVVASNNDGPPINPNGPAKDKFGIKGGGIVAYDLDKAGNISHGRVFFRSEEGMAPDGSAMDTEGNLYLAQHNGNPDAPKTDIVVLSPSGKALEHLPVPGKGLTTNLAFGRGVDRHSLYVTTGAPWGLYRIQTVKVGHYF